MSTHSGQAPGNLTLRMAKGAGWMVLLRLAHSAIGVLSTVILARLLLPGDFGLIAMASAMITALGLLTTFKFEAALIQNQAAGRDHYDTAWTLNVLLGTLLAALLALLARPAALFYGEPRVEAILYVLALATFIESFQNIGIVAFQKELNFGREFGFMMLKKLAGFCVTIPLAFAWRNYWALAAGILATSIAGNAASYLMHPYRPRLALVATRELVQFSRWLLLDNLIYVLRNRSADFIIGKLGGSRQLGVFAMAHEIATLVSANLLAPISRATLPGYAQMAADPGVLRAGYLSVLEITAMITLPAAVGIGAIAPVLVPAVLGPKWLDTIAPMQVLAVASALALMMGNAAPAYIAAGKPRLVVGVSGAYVITLLPALFLLIPEGGPLGAAWAFLLAAAANVPVTLWLTRRTLELSPADWIRRLWRPVGASVIMYAIVTGATLEMPPAAGAAGQIAQLLLFVVLGAVTYTAAVLGLWQIAGRPQGAERTLLNQLARRRAGAPAHSPLP